VKTKKTGIKLVDKQTDEGLAAEWDKLAPYREELISSGRDLSYHRILSPSLRSMLTDLAEFPARVLDVGCGTGKFLETLAIDNPTGRFVGIDPSSTSINVATSRPKPSDNIEFRACSAEDFATDDSRHGTYDGVIANMLLQNVADLDDVLAACRLLLKAGGVFIFAISHPCFWPRYWGYDEEPWFEYDKELWIEAPFRTSLSATVDPTLRTTHVHRPLHRYLNGLGNAGMTLEKIAEPIPDDGIEGAYPVAWEFPRFLIGRARRTS